MDSYSASDAQNKLQKLIDHVADSHEPVRVSGKNNKAVLISEEDFEAIQETLYILSVPGMRESIEEGRKEKIEDCSKDLPW